ncbi:MAG: tRNA pseudouridine(38-40) synthase TruA [Flavobacteriaceae bacterium]
MKMNCYLFTVRYLGFRYSGWQKQPKQKTLEEMLFKTFRFVLPDREFKLLGAGRTDAKVSALEGAFELFVKGDPLLEKENLKSTLNKNLPSDIEILNMYEVDDKFNIIQSSKEKEYMYLFSHGGKNHPYSAPFITGTEDQLDIDLMREGAALFVGTHNFKAYTTVDSEGKQLVRTVSLCTIVPNEFLHASFFPDISYALLIRSEGFLRYQVRMIMGALLQLGKYQLSLEEIKASLARDSEFMLDTIAPASGLHLRSIDFGFKE